MRDKLGRFTKGTHSKTEFKKGHKLSKKTKQKMKGRVPWNKNKGVSISLDIGNNLLNIIQKITGDKRSKGYIDSKGYRRYKIKGKTYKEHRLVWEICYGKIQKGYDVHHKDGNKLNNDINNLEVIKHGRHSRRSARKISRGL